MNVRRILLGFAAAALLTCTALPVRAADEKPAMDQEAQMKEWMKIASPSEGHAVFDKYVGKWNADVKSWMDPAAPPMESKGSAEFSKMFGGRYMVQSFHGSMMGMPFEGHGMTGYDNFRKEYQSTWMDDMSTAMMVMRGNRKSDGTFELAGTMDDPMTGQKDMKMRTVEKWVDDDHFNFSMYCTMTGQEMKMMEISYTRAK
ncbi:MAG TPA: DUF1579 domain-containing protein [Candidatus Eisenbacteria bacterium]